MTKPFEYGPLQTYEVIWKSGHVEQVQAHQCMLPPSPMFGDAPSPRANRITFHGEIDGRWMLVLDADYGDISSVRRVDPVRPESAATSTDGN